MGLVNKFSQMLNAISLLSFSLALFTVFLMIVAAVCLFHTEENCWRTTLTIGFFLLVVSTILVFVVCSILALTIPYYHAFCTPAMAALNDPR